MSEHKDFVPRPLFTVTPALQQPRPVVWFEVNTTSRQDALQGAYTGHARYLRPHEVRDLIQKLTEALETAERHHGIRDD